MPGMAFVPSEGTLYGTSGQTDSLYTINTTTGVATLIGALDTNTSFNGLAYEAATDSLYMSDSVSDHLFLVNRVTGAATTIGSGFGFFSVNGLAGVNME